MSLTVNDNNYFKKPVFLGMRFPLKIKITPEDAVFMILLVLFSFIYPIPASVLSYEEVASVMITDRNGYPLREILSSQEGRGRWTPLDRISERVVHTAVIAEDKRFYSHPGFDLLATCRALWQNFTSGATVSGGSTITQQLIRNLYHFPRHPFFKAAEIWYAVRMEHTLNKERILEQYLNRIPFGNQTFGIEAAAQLYFGKPAAELTWAEAAFLMSLPKSPTVYNPYKNMERARQRQKSILKKIYDAGIINKNEYHRALDEPVILFPKTSPFNAPHFVDLLINHPTLSGPVVRTTIDLPLQSEIQTIVRGHIAQLTEEQVTNAAVVVLDNRSGNLLAMVGSSDYFDTAHDGQFNAALSPRQPGSALKPFTYAVAFEEGYTPATIIPDIETVIPTDKGTYTPINYDNRFHGPVRVRTALACSYNIPAVRVLQQLGTEKLLAKLHHCGMRSLDQTADYYGHGLTLGNGAVTLWEMTRAYALFANHGRLRDIKIIQDDTDDAVPVKVFSEETAYLITSILSDAAARAPAFGFDSPLNLPFPCASKTGTSSDFRDNWTIGYTPDYTVGVWTGNFDNSPMKRISGITGAGPIFRDIMLYLYYRHKTPSEFKMPPTIVKVRICGLSGVLPHAGCSSVLEEFFPKDKIPRSYCRAHLPDGRVNYLALSPLYREWAIHTQSVMTRTHNAIHDTAGSEQLSEICTLKIIYPTQGSEFRIDPNFRSSHQSIYFEALAPTGVSEVTWYLNDRLYQKTSWPFQSLWNLQPGRYTLIARARNGRSELKDEVSFEVKN